MFISEFQAVVKCIISDFQTIVNFQHEDNDYEHFSSGAFRLHNCGGAAGTRRKWRIIKKEMNLHFVNPFSSSEWFNWFSYKI